MILSVVWYDVLINFVVFLIPILFGAFAARRLNFIHGTIVTLAWYAIIGGVYLVTVAHGNDVSWLQNVKDFMEKYFAFAMYVPVTIATYVVNSETLQKVEVFAKGAPYWAYVFCFVSAIVVWLISRIISGSIRYRRGY